MNTGTAKSGIEKGVDITKLFFQKIYASLPLITLTLIVWVAYGWYEELEIQVAKHSEKVAVFSNQSEAHAKYANKYYGCVFDIFTSPTTCQLNASQLVKNKALTLGISIESMVDQHTEDVYFEFPSLMKVISDKKNQFCELF